MKLLLTGHCGFIGQNFVRLYADEHEIVGIDKMGYASDKDALSLCVSYQEDIAAQGFIKKFERICSAHGPFDAIINFAAESHVDNSIKSPRTFVDSNIIGTFNMLEIARHYKIARFLQVGTDEVYGDLRPNDPPFSNLYEMKPSSPYSASKAAADMLVMSYCRTYGLDGIITRSCNNYGPHQYHEKLIPVVITKALKNQPIPVYGDGSNMREWIYVDDNCRGIMAALINGKSKQIYNLGSGIEKTNLDLVKEILFHLDRPPTLIEMVEDRKGHDFRYFLDSQNSYSELSWDIQTDFSDGIRATIEHYMAKEDL